jgi:hypothetical protein
MTFSVSLSCLCSRTATLVRRHQPSDRALGVAEERDDDSIFLRREETQQLTRYGGRYEAIGMSDGACLHLA